MNHMGENTCPRLIEVALPIREISAESVRDKSLRHGHISTLHLWWARRPLAASRAVVFASLVPDPDDERCPELFRKAVARNLRDKVPASLKWYTRGRDVVPDEDPYRPYEGIEDTLRNRLLMFIAKWSPEYLEFERGDTNKQPKPTLLLDDRSLVKWETSDPENPQGRKVLEVARELVRAAYNGKTPTVLDPFAGGGAIPLEAGRLGCQAIANDYNPVAYLILRATCEFPQKYGKPGKRLVRREHMGTIQEEGIDVPNVLAYDVEHWAEWILERAEEKIGHLYAPGEDGRTVVGYLWARTAPCSNPACRAEIPLLRSLLICSKSGKRVALTMKLEGKETKFGIAKDKAIKHTEGTMLSRGNCRCPVCKQVTPVNDIREAGLRGELGERMVAAITEAPGGKDYRAIETNDVEVFSRAANLAKQVERPSERILPEITGGDGEGIANSTGIRVHLYGLKTWGSLYNSRQLLAMQTFVSSLREAVGELSNQIEDEEYRKAVTTYLGLWVSRNSMRMSTVGRWNVNGEKVETPFDGARLPMKSDYPEANPFCGVTGGFANQLNWILHCLRHEAGSATGAFVRRGDGAALDLTAGGLDLLVSDPPYFDEAAYADLSDFFYIWLKRCLSSELPEFLTTPQSPKSEEATALKHRHDGDASAADRHFRNKLAAVFAEGKRVCRENSLATIIFAHQETEAWLALIDALFSAGLTIDATWPIEMELKNRMRGLNSAALETSITVICRPRVVGSAASFREVRREIERVTQESVQRFWSYGFRGADLIVACYGPAVGVFSRYGRVERADGTTVNVETLLQLARESALKAISGEFTGDGISRLYFVWANLYGVSEQAWDDARTVVQIGGDAEEAMEVARYQGVFVVDGSKCRLALMSDRVADKQLGLEANPPLIDALHRGMWLWKQEQRPQLVDYLGERDLLEDASFWKLGQALFEVLPRDCEDWRLISALLGERETLRREFKGAARQDELF